MSVWLHVCTADHFLVRAPARWATCWCWSRATSARLGRRPVRSRASCSPAPWQRYHQMSLRSGAHAFVLSGLSVRCFLPPLPSSKATRAHVSTSGAAALPHLSRPAARVCADLTVPLKSLVSPLGRPHRVSQTLHDPCRCGLCRRLHQTLRLRRTIAAKPEIGTTVPPARYDHEYAVLRVPRPWAGPRR